MNNKGTDQTAQIARLVCEIVVRKLQTCFSSIEAHINGILICLFDLILYVPVNNLSVMLGRVFLG